MANLAVADDAAVGEFVAALPALTRAVLLYLADLCNHVVEREALNKMGRKNLAIVFAPK